MENFVGITGAARRASGKFVLKLLLKIKIKGIEGAPALPSCALNFSRGGCPPVFQGGCPNSPPPFKPPLFETKSCRQNRSVAQMYRKLWNFIVIFHIFLVMKFY